MQQFNDNNNLQSIAKQIRIDLIRTLENAKSGHLGGSLGMADVFAVLYFNSMNHDPKNPEWSERDRLILSIGHIAPVLYVSLANAGYFDKSELLTLRSLGSRLQGHPGKDHGLPGIEISSGSLGQGLSVAVGIALTGKIDNKTWNVFAILGDGELQEGSVWEAAMSASHYKLDNLIAIVDRNFVQIDGLTTDVMNLEPLEEKWKSFGWNVLTCNGNDIPEIVNAIRKAKNTKSVPTVIIAKTKMGKGVKSIEGDYRWHGKVPNRNESEIFISEIEENE